MKNSILGLIVAFFALFPMAQKATAQQITVTDTIVTTNTVTIQWIVTGFTTSFQAYADLLENGVAIETQPDPITWVSGDTVLMTTTFSGLQAGVCLQQLNQQIVLNASGPDEVAPVVDIQNICTASDLAVATTGVQNSQSCAIPNGQMTATISGGTAPFTYLWNTGATTSSLSGLSAGTYDVTVTDAYGNTATATSTITGPTASANVVLNPTSVTCNGLSNGSIATTVSGGVTPYTFLWNDGAMTEDRASLTANIYTVTVTEGNGCAQNKTTTVAQPAVLAINSQSTPVLCSGNHNGTITSVANGGTAPYTYGLSGIFGGNQTGNFSNLYSGSYTASVTDARGCTASLQVSVASPAPLTVSNVKTNVLCFGGSTGTINLTISGGNGNYMFMWNDGTTTEDRTGLTIGTYSATITDINGCSVTTGNITITQPFTALNTSETHTNVTVFGGNNGNVNLTVTGGTTPYSYSWDNGATTEDISLLTGGTYSVTVTDANGCTVQRSVTVTAPGQALGISNTTTAFNGCYGGWAGEIVVSAVGGTAPYTYSKNNGLFFQSSNTFSGLQAGTYQVVVKDMNGVMTNAQSVTITQPNTLQTAVQVTAIGYNGQTPGFVDLTVTGGTTPYTYFWNTGATTEDISVNLAGTYSVTVTDANGCTITRNNISVTQQTIATFTIELSGGGSIPQQIVGVPFSVQIKALDVTGNVVIGFNGTVSMTGTGNPLPQLTQGGGTTVQFTNGTLSFHTVQIGNAGTFRLNVAQTGGTAIGQSAQFAVIQPIGAAPNIVSLSTDSLPINSPNTTITIIGENFQPGAIVTVNGTNALVTQYLDSQHLLVAISQQYFDNVGELWIGARNPDGQTAPIPQILTVFNFVLTLHIIDATYVDWTGAFVTCQYNENYYGTITLTGRCGDTPNALTEASNPYPTDDVTGEITNEFVTWPSRWYYYDFVAKKDGIPVAYSQKIQFFSASYVGIQELALTEGTILSVNDVLDNGREFTEYRNVEFGIGKPMPLFPENKVCAYTIQTKFDGKIWVGQIHRSGK